MYKIIAIQSFVEHFKKLDFYVILNICRKIELLRENPFRHKSLSVPNYFSMRFVDNAKGKRLIYCVVKDSVELVCIIDRSNEYKDLHKYIKNG